MSEKKSYGRKLGLAILISIVLHLAVGFSLAAFGNVFNPPVLPEEEKPSELTLMDLAPAPEKEKNPQFVDVDKSKESAEKPKEQTFESNANSLAASEPGRKGFADPRSGDARFFIGNPGFDAGAPATFAAARDKALAAAGEKSDARSRTARDAEIHSAAADQSAG